MAGTPLSIFFFIHSIIHINSVLFLNVSIFTDKCQCLETNSHSVLTVSVTLGNSIPGPCGQPEGKQ